MIAFLFTSCAHRSAYLFDGESITVESYESLSVGVSDRRVIIRAGELNEDDYVVLGEYDENLEEE